MMKITMFKIIAWLVILPCFSCCQNYLQISNSDNPVRKTINERFDITLEACHDGGYRWFLEPVDTTKLKLFSCISKTVSEKFTFGGNVYEIWTFAGLQRGEYELVFNYRRPWITQIEKTEKISVFIN